jgi:hypothetical protein
VIFFVAMSRVIYSFIHPITPELQLQKRLTKVPNMGHMLSWCVRLQGEREAIPKNQGFVLLVGDVIGSLRLWWPRSLGGTVDHGPSSAGGFSFFV